MEIYTNLVKIFNIKEIRELLVQHVREKLEKIKNKNNNGSLYYGTSIKYREEFSFFIKYDEKKLFFDTQLPISEENKKEIDILFAEFIEHYTSSPEKEYIFSTDPIEIRISFYVGEDTSFNEVEIPIRVFENYKENVRVSYSCFLSVRANLHTKMTKKRKSSTLAFTPKYSVIPENSTDEKHLDNFLKLLLTYIVSFSLYSQLEKINDQFMYFVSDKKKLFVDEHIFKYFYVFLNLIQKHYSLQNFAIFHLPEAGHITGNVWSRGNMAMTCHTTENSGFYKIFFIFYPIEDNYVPLLIQETYNFQVEISVDKNSMKITDSTNNFSQNLKKRFVSYSFNDMMEETETNKYVSAYLEYGRLALKKEINKLGIDNTNKNNLEEKILNYLKFFLENVLFM